MTLRSIVPVALLLAVASISSAQAPPPAATGKGILRGRVTRLDNGQPLRQVLVSITGSDLPPTLPFDTTDDRGEFRIYGIPPGTYYLSAMGPLSRELNLSGPPLSPSTSPSFYPGTSSPETAQPITVAPGREVGGLSFALVRAATATVTALVRTADGRTVTRTPSQQTLAGVTRVMDVGGAPISTIEPPRPDGSVSWTDLPPGEYVVSATTTEFPVSPTTAPAREALEARMTVAAAATRVTLSGTDVRVELTLQKLDVARGRIMFDADASAGSLHLEQARVRAVSFDKLDTAQTFTALPRTNADGTFETTLTQGARLLQLSVPAGWAVKSIRMGDADVTDTPLPLTGRDIEGITILLTNRLTEVSGVVRGANGQPVDDATVVLFADDPGRWRWPSRFVAAVRADQNGRFSHRGLPPARYVVVALDYLESGEETNPELLRRLQPLGARFALADRESTTIDVTLSALP